MSQNPDDDIDDGDPKRGRMEELEMRVEELEGELKVLRNEATDLCVRAMAYTPQDAALFDDIVKFLGIPLP